MGHTPSSGPSQNRAGQCAFLLPMVSFWVGRRQGLHSAAVLNRDLSGPMSRKVSSIAQYSRNHGGFREVMAGCGLAGSVTGLSCNCT